MPEYILPDEVKKEIKDIVTDAIEDAGKAGWPICALENQKVTAIQEIAKANQKLLTGNGDPEKGLIMKVDRLITSSDILQKEIKSVKMAAWTLSSAAVLWFIYEILSHVFGS